MNRPVEIPVKKKPYESPKLLVYGNLADLTRSKGSKGKRDIPRGSRRFTGA